MVQNDNTIPIDSYPPLIERDRKIVQALFGVRKGMLESEIVESTGMTRQRTHAGLRSLEKQNLAFSVKQGGRNYWALVDGDVASTFVGQGQAIIDKEFVLPPKYFDKKAGERFISQVMPKAYPKKQTPYTPLEIYAGTLRARRFAGRKLEELARMLKNASSRKSPSK